MFQHLQAQDDIEGAIPSGNEAGIGYNRLRQPAFDDFLHIDVDPNDLRLLVVVAQRQVKKRLFITSDESDIQDA
jgi:hypothetical protein